MQLINKEVIQVLQLITLIESGSINGRDFAPVYLGSSANDVAYAERNFTEWNGVHGGEYDNRTEAYRAWRDESGYHKGEGFWDHMFRRMGSNHIEIMLDEESGGGLMYGGFGKAPSLASQISAEAEAQSFKSLNSRINPTKVAEYFEQMSNGTYNQPVGVGGFKWEGKFYFNEGNHKMSAAIQYKIKTGSYKYMDMLMKNAKFDYANPANYGKIYKFPVKPTRK